MHISRQPHIAQADLRFEPKMTEKVSSCNRKSNLKTRIQPVTPPVRFRRFVLYLFNDCLRLAAHVRDFFTPVEQPE